MNRVPVRVISMILLCGPAVAIDNPLESGLLKCAKETAQPARLACFDALVAAIPAVKADRIGLTAEIARRREPSDGDVLEKRVALPGKIVALSVAPRGEIIFVLDNQQVWMQTQVEPSKHFSVGDAVHIESGAMGSYWLAADKARRTKVKRVS